MHYNSCDIGVTFWSGSNFLFSSHTKTRGVAILWIWLSEKISHILQNAKQGVYCITYTTKAKQKMKSWKDEKEKSYKARQKPTSAEGRESRPWTKAGYNQCHVKEIQRVCVWFLSSVPFWWKIDLWKKRWQSIGKSFLFYNPRAKSESHYDRARTVTV